MYVDDDLISVIDAAKQLGRVKQSMFKVLRRLGIETVKRRHQGSKNQFIAYITQSDFKRLITDLQLKERFERSDDNAPDSDDFVSAEIGVFYLIQLEPEIDPNRFKAGFSGNMAERLRQLRCSAPFASVLKTWSCKRLWEKTAIDCVSAGCERLHTEVFRAVEIADVIKKCEQLFDLLPSLRDGKSTVENVAPLLYLEPNDPRVQAAVPQQIKEMPFSELDARLAPRNLGVIERQFPDPTPVTREELQRRENQQA